MWRRQNLLTYRLAEQAKAEGQRIREQFIPPAWECLFDQSAEEREALRQKRRKADEKAQAELGTAWELVQLSHVTTTDHLLKELSVLERVDCMIDRALKRLLFVRGLKSMSPPRDKASPPLRLVSVKEAPTTS
jgi:hypothetical protein